MSFKRRLYEPPPSAPLKPLEKPPRYGAAELAPAPKETRALLSDADQRKLYGHVAGLECGRCWRHGRTQVSHSNQLIDGKGRSLKAHPWRIAALCDECHALIDQGRDMTKDERREAWNAAHRWTLGELFARGLVRPV
jgi:hypothetical protein